jgi:protein-tyrosine-phosphatase
MKKQIIFICNGNIERSVIAAECLKNTLRKNRISSKFLVDSYGLQGTNGTTLPKHKHLSEYTKEWNAARPILKKLKIDISNHSFQKITPNIAEEASVIIAMDEKVYSKKRNALLKQFKKQKNKIHIISELTSDNKGIKDPAGSGSKKLHKQVIEKIYSILDKNYETIIGWTDKS